VILARGELYIVASDAPMHGLEPHAPDSVTTRNRSASVRSRIGSLILGHRTLQLGTDGDRVAAPSHGLLNSYVDITLF
jgi:hypothetical protein